MQNVYVKRMLKKKKFCSKPHIKIKRQVTLQVITPHLQSDGVRVPQMARHICAILPNQVWAVTITY